MVPKSKQPITFIVLSAKFPNFCVSKFLEKLIVAFTFLYSTNNLANLQPNVFCKRFWFHVPLKRIQGDTLGYVLIAPWGAFAFIVIVLSCFYDGYMMFFVVAAKL